MTLTQGTTTPTDVPVLGIDHPVLEGRHENLARRFLHNKVATVGLAFLFLVILCAIFSKFFTPFNPNEQDLNHALEAPSWSHLAGTDNFGRDQFSRLIAGASVSIKAALEATGIGFLVGVPLGMFAGFARPITDTALSRMNDGLMAVPGIIFALAVAAALGPSLTHAMIAIGILFVPLFFRIARASTMSVKEETYIEACHAIGCRRSRTIWRHIFPNVLSPIVVQLAVLAGVAIAAEASLSFLGIGVAPPQASWGSMIQTAIPNMNGQPYLVIFPGVAITLTVMALTLVGDGLRDALRKTR